MQGPLCMPYAWHVYLMCTIHAGVHELSCFGRPLLLVNMLVGPNAQPSPYAALAPPVEAIFTAARFRRAVERLGPAAGRLCSARRAIGST